MATALELRIRATHQRLINDASNLIASQGFPYADLEGTRSRAFRVDELNKALRELNGWRNTSAIDGDMWKRLGFKVLRLTYVGGARPTGRYVEVITL